MTTQPAPDPFEEFLGEEVVIDLRSPFVCLGKLAAIDRVFLTVIDADLHDFRDSRATREIYVHDSARLGIRRNRKRVLVNREELVAIGRLTDVLEA